MRRWLAFLLAAALWCAPVAAQAPERVVVLLGSYAEAWLLAGGALVGTTEDAVSERGLALDASVMIVGTTKAPGLEKILSLEPDCVIFSSDIPAQAEIGARLEAMGIEVAGFSVQTSAEYMDMMAVFCQKTGCTQCLARQKRDVEAPVAAAVARAAAHPAYGRRTALLLRAYGGGVKAKNSDNLAGAMLRDMGLVNIADDDGTLMENLSLEAIVQADPDYIFVVAMGGDEREAMDAMRQNLTSNPAWAGLTAVAEGRLVTLDRTLFHLKPNARWAEAYAYLEALLYGP